MASGCVAIQTRHGQGKHCDMAQEACGDTATQACDTARPGLRHGAVCAQARQGVHLVHPTSFGLSALFLSHCFGTLFMSTVHKIFFLNEIIFF